MRALLAVVAVAVAVAGAHSSATTILAADLGDLTRDARIIARGQVVALDVSWTLDHHGIETLVTLQVDAYLKGALGPTLQFRVPGGRLGRFQSMTVGAPTFAVGQRIVVFLGAQGPSVLHVLGLSQGVFQLAPANGGWVVTPPAILPTKATAPIVRGDLSRRALPLADFEQQVRALAGTAQ